MKYVSFFALLVCISPSFLVWWGLAPQSLLSPVMIFGTLLWFATAPLWIKKEEEVPEEPAI